MNVRRGEAGYGVRGSYRFEKPAPYELKFPEGDYIGQRILALGTPYEYYAIRAVAALAGRGTTIVDVGANIGNHTCCWAAMGHRVVAFEPNPVALGWLRRNINVNGLDSLVTVHPIALGDRPGRARLQTPRLTNLGATSVVSDDRGEFAIERLDDQVRTGRVGCVKIDVEGAEESVLRGSQQVLRSDRPFVMIELWDANARSVADDLLRPIGYKRFPALIGGGPTHLYVPGVRGLIRALASSRTIWAAIRVAISNRPKLRRTA